ncbi:MAG TPA: uracil phosphoribosyltransferase [Bacteriovoracaceae bacterium]|nr:uracil phosphoribosyltransferase [Bacteriovoracaceae bacterium]
MYKNLTLLKHPLLSHKLGHLRDKTTNSADFRSLMTEISKLLAYEAMKDWDQMDVLEVETPISPTKIERIMNPPVAVAILRAGNGMLDGVLSMIPIASTGFIGIYRDKFIHNTVEYYFKLPADVKGRTVLLCDPLIATADTILAAIDRLKSYHTGPIKVLSVLTSDHALKRLEHFHPDVKIFALNVEMEMTENGYLVPGLGDAGDRLYQTK